MPPLVLGSVFQGGMAALVLLDVLLVMSGIMLIKTAWGVVHHALLAVTGPLWVHMTILHACHARVQPLQSQGVTAARSVPVAVIQRFLAINAINVLQGRQRTT